MKNKAQQWNNENTQIIFNCYLKMVVLKVERQSAISEVSMGKNRSAPCRLTSLYCYVDDFCCSVNHICLLFHVWRDLNFALIIPSSCGEIDDQCFCRESRKLWRRITTNSDRSYCVCFSVVLLFWLCAFVAYWFGKFIICRIIYQPGRSLENGYCELKRSFISAQLVLISNGIVSRWIVVWIFSHNSFPSL